MAQEKKERIFISYKRVDKDRVFAIKDGIERATGEKCWIDLDGIESNAQFVAKIVSAIDECEVFLFMRSKEHNNITNLETDWTIREVNYALEEHKNIVIVNLDKTPMPKWFKFMFPNKQEIDATDPEKVDRLYKDLCGWLGIAYNEFSNQLKVETDESVSLGSVQELQEQIAQAEAAKKELEKKMRLAEEEKRLAEEILPRMNINNVNINSNLIHADAAAKVLDNSNNRLDFIVNGVPFSMIKVEGGTFMMGATPEQGVDASLMERPSHQVTLSDYYIGETLVTQALWQSVMGNNPSIVKNNQHPVENVSWEDCQKFIQKLRSLTGQQFRIPTEAEWEFAARGGNKSRGYKYAGGDDINKLAWYNNSRIGWYSDCTRTTQAVKLKLPNELGIYDMSGNLQEWCQDWYDDYENSSQTNPKGPISGRWKVTRGGSCDEDARKCRVSWRDKHMPMSEYNRYIGIRLSL